MSETKEESNSTSSDVKEEEEGSPKTEEAKTDESSKDSDKDSKDSVKNDKVKEDSGKDDSEKDDSEDESDDEIGLLDRPVEVSGCRARKKVERLEISFTGPKEKSQSIPEGKGKKLGECPKIETQIQKTSFHDLKPLHRILFMRVGSATEIKRNIRKFSGFTFGKNSSEFDKKKAQIEKLTGPILKQICTVLDIERSGLKEEIVNRVLEFLLEPKDSGKGVSKKKTSNKDKKKSTVKKAKNSKAKVEKEASSGDDSDTAKDSASDKDSDKDEKEENDDKDDKESDSDSEPVKKKSKKAKTTKKAPPKKAEKKDKPKKEEKKGSAKGSKRKREEDSDEESEDEPAPKKKGPSDDEIKKLVKTILKDADLQEITMKKVIKQVAEAFPSLDLSHRKAFIKATIKSCIS